MALLTYSENCTVSQGWYGTRLRSCTLVGHLSECWTECHMPWSLLPLFSWRCFACICFMLRLRDHQVLNVSVLYTIHLMCLMLCAALSNCLKLAHMAWQKSLGMVTVKHMNGDAAEVNRFDSRMVPGSFLYEKEPGYKAKYAMCTLILAPLASSSSLILWPPRPIVKKTQCWSSHCEHRHWPPW